MMMSLTDLWLLWSLVSVSLFHATLCQRPLHLSLLSTRFLNTSMCPYLDVLIKADQVEVKHSAVSLQRIIDSNIVVPLTPLKLLWITDSVTVLMQLELLKLVHPSEMCQSGKCINSCVILYNYSKYSSLTIFLSFSKTIFKCKQLHIICWRLYQLTFLCHQTLMWRAAVKAIIFFTCTMTLKLGSADQI